jgi:hypothetical protein
MSNIKPSNAIGSPPAANATTLQPPKTNNKGNSTQINNLLAKLKANQPTTSQEQTSPLTNIKMNEKQSNNTKKTPILNNKNNLSQNDIENLNKISGMSTNEISKMNNKQLENALAKLNNENKKLSENIEKKKANEKSKEKANNDKKNEKSKESVNESTKNKVSDSAKKNEIALSIEAEGESKLSYFIKIVIVIIIIVAFVYLVKYLISRYQLSLYSSTNLLKNSKNAKYPLVISQDPTSVNYTPIKRSEDKDGAQFTYGFWFLIDNFDYKKGEWKHVFHKGNDTSFPNRAPGVWFHPDKNSVRVYMNTQDNILEHVDVDNIPIRKWVYMNIILNQTTNKTDSMNSNNLVTGTINLDIYINGFLKIRKELSSLPKQNDDDLWINMFGGFEGYVSNIKYYPYAITYSEINDEISAGPSKNNCIDTGEIPPYLDDNWWFNNKNH